MPDVPSGFSPQSHHPNLLGPSNPAPEVQLASAAPLAVLWVLHQRHASHGRLLPYDVGDASASATFSLSSVVCIPLKEVATVCASRLSSPASTSSSRELEWVSLPVKVFVPLVVCRGVLVVGQSILGAWFGGSLRLSQCTSSWLWPKIVCLGS